MDTMPTRLRALLFANGIGLFILAISIGWIWFAALLHAIVLWPLPIDIPVTIPDDGRAWRMAHMEGITQGLLLMALGLGGQFMRLTRKQYAWLFWSSLVTAWLFTVPTIFNAIFGTRGLAFGGGPFKGGMANDIIYLVGWPPVVAVHIMLALAAFGVWRFLKHEKG
ncbi:MAG: hypothetical protein K8R18_14985 [Parvibaculum sp.]|uniref:hypothetical protein n=1 Tax=Parvibaculum sp. TaxID=2024848 RepID=UPI0025CEF3D3|nr:hypothetical protein [Parvibaculum sp.]MCE9650922.1 hypothetical protein [Parvibaculum sp.]